MSSLGTAIIVILTAIFIGYQLNQKPPNNSAIVDMKLEAEYDYIVVGAGSAGSVVAARLSGDKENRVLLLEAGGHFSENDALLVPLIWGTMLRTKYDWQYYTEPHPDYFQGLKENRGYLPRGRVLGGTSCLNAMVYTRGSPFDFDEWAAAGCEGWSYKEALPFFLKAEDVNIDELDQSPYHSKGGPLSNSYSYRTELSDAYLKVGKELGYEITDYNGEDQEGFSTVQKNIRNGVRSSTGIEYIGNTETKKNLHVSLHSLATKIDISNKKAVGIYFIKNGKKQYAKCKKEIVVSAGAINSPQLLMLSGIGPKAHLSELGIEVKADLPVGQNFQDHPLIFFRNTIKKPISITPGAIGNVWNRLRYKFFHDGPLATSGLEGSAFIHLDKTKRGKTYPDIHLVFISFLLRENFLNLRPEVAEEFLEKDDDAHGITVAVCLTRPKSVGSLTLRSTDPFDHPIIETGFFTDSQNEDLETMLAGIRIYEQILETKVFKELGATIEDGNFRFCSEYKFRTDEYWKCVIRIVATSAYHLAGTCRMGARDNPTAVVDPQLRVIGIDGLRVADASVFPNVTSGNTNNPTIMVGEKAAAMIRGITL